MMPSLGRGVNDLPPIICLISRRERIRIIFSVSQSRDVLVASRQVKKSTKASTASGTIQAEVHRLEALAPHTTAGHSSPLPWQIVMITATSQRCTRAMNKIDTASGATERCTELATQGEMRPAWRYAGVRRAGNRSSHDARSPGNVPEE